MRAIPHLVTFRPADANEVAEAYRTIMPWKNRPAILVLTRQNVPTFDRTIYAPASGVSRGAYVLADAEGGRPAVLLMATGSEVSLCVAAYEQLKKEGIAARVISMPSWELFDEQDLAYRDSVLPPAVTARVAVEAGVEQGWGKYLGPHGKFQGMRGFGASGPADKVFEHFGFTVKNVVALAREAMQTAAGKS
jgi:transketolase